MNKIELDGVVVVEGKNDASKLANILSSPIIITNGADVSETLIKFLKKVELKNKIYLMLDPDEAGRQISKKLEEKLINFEKIELISPIFVSAKKHGVHEMDSKYLINVLGKYAIKNKTRKNMLNISEMYLIRNDLNIDQIIKDFCLTRKTFSGIITELNILNISKEELISKYGIR